ncbi:MAG: hypothetical protein M1817_001529 [Caeruleum heppii]|nr:MAG: hypothetical protein M1817_001529 [Caeruleum heppii]
MPPSPSTPRTPTHSRLPSLSSPHDHPHLSPSEQYPSPASQTSSPTRSRRRSSLASSLNTPLSPRRTKMNGGNMVNSMSMSSDLAGSSISGDVGAGEEGGIPAGGADNGLGSLADELGGAWGDDDDDEEEDEEVEDDDGINGAADENPTQLKSSPTPNGTSNADTPTASPNPNRSSSPPPPSPTQPHRRYPSSSSASGFTPSLEARMATIADLARYQLSPPKTAESDGAGVEEDIIKRFRNSLVDLGGQAGVESGVSRTSTSTLTTHLAALTDTLQILHQTHLLASRRLKASLSLVQDLRREEERAEEGRGFLEKGGWGERLERRECAGVVREVVSGFEGVCEEWRRRLGGGVAEGAGAEVQVV